EVVEGSPGRLVTAGHLGGEGGEIKRGGRCVGVHRLPFDQSAVAWPWCDVLSDHRIFTLSLVPRACRRARWEDRDGRPRCGLIPPPTSSRGASTARVGPPR